MKVKPIQLFYFLLFFSVLTQVVTATGGGNVGTWYGYVLVNNTIVASDNTTIVSAYINSTSTIAGNTTVGAARCELSNCTGFYYIDAQANQGENITFKICGVNASQGQQTFSAGPHSLLNLSINKSANGANCTYACGCTGGYCVHNYCSAASTYCGDGYCDTGESCRADNSACSSGYTCTNGCVATGGTGGGGGGGGGTVTPTTTVTLAIGNANITILSIGAGNTSNITITKTDDVAFRQINITVDNAVSNIKIIITKLAGLPVSIPQSIEGEVYHYIYIDLKNITDADIDKVYIKFAVSKSWLTSNNIDFSNIALYRWVNNLWVQLPTTYVSETTTEVFFSAESAGLSYFVIGTKQPITPIQPACTESWSCTDWSTCIDNQQTRTCTDANSCGTTADKPVESQSCKIKEEVIPTLFIPTTENVFLIYYIVAAVIFIIIAIILFIFRKKISFKIPKPAIKEEHKKRQIFTGTSFIVAGVVVTLVPAILYIVFGDIGSILKYCNLPFSTVDIGSNTMINCVELRFYFVLSCFCLLFGSILIIWGLIKKAIELKFTKTL
jgi:PGF-pre-PGF domain-containing protein